MNPKLLLLAASISALTGCAAIENGNTLSGEMKQQQADAQQNIVQNLRSAKKSVPGPLQIMDKPWVSLKPVDPFSTQKIQALSCPIRVASSNPISITAIGQIITRFCGTQVRITQDAMDHIDGISVTQNSTGSNGAFAQPLMALPVQNSNTTRHSDRMDVNYNGELTGLLNMVASRFRLSWKVDGGEIIIYYLDSKTFYLDTLSSDTSMSSTMQSGTTMVNGETGGSSGSDSSGGIGGNSQTNQNTTVTLKTSVWKDVQNTISSMLSPAGKVAVSPATGAITVTDNQDVLRRVNRYINSENTSLTKQVLFTIKVLSVTTNDSNGFGISWDLVYKDLANKFGFNFGNAFSMDGGSSGTFSILKDSASPWAGSSAIVKALAEQGNVSIVRNPSASTLNLQPVALQVAKQNGYVVSTSTSTTPLAGSTTSLQTGMITTGFNMSLLPYVMKDNQMLLQFSINLSNLRNLRTVKQGNALAELPELDLPINSTQRVRLSPGDTLMLTGFDQDDKTVKNQGVGSAKNWLFGGGVNGAHSRSTLVVLITPTILK